MFKDKVILFLKDPLNNYKKIIPYLHAKSEPYKRDIYELFGSDHYSKPYAAIDDLFEVINMHDGFFVETGGNDGYFHSPSYYLEKFKGWKGVLIEPLPIWKLCQRNRKDSTVYNYACVSSDYLGEVVTLIDCNAMSVIKDGVDGYKEWVKLGEKAQNIVSKEVIVKCLTLSQILDDHFQKYGLTRIDLLILDVEGYEIEVLKGFEIERFFPRFILIEMHDDIRRTEIEKEIFKNFYKLVKKIGATDFIYRYTGEIN